MVTTATGIFPYNMQPVNNIAAFTYRTGTTFMEMLEEMRVYLNENMRPEFNTALQAIADDFQAGILNAEEAAEQAIAYVNASIQFINNKTGQAQIQRVLLTAPYTVAIDPLWPNNHPINIVLTQDATGGRVVTWDSEDINNTLPVSTAPNAETDFWLVPEGDGTWTAVQWATGAELDAEVTAINTALGTKANASSLALKADKATTVTAGAPLVAVLGVIRNSGAGWQLISDTGHEPVGIDSIETTSTSITVNYAGAAASKVGTFIVDEDETLSAQGFSAGASVAADKAVISLSRTVPSYSDYVAYSAGAWVSANGVFDATWDTANSVLTLSHPAISGNGLNVSLASRPGTTGILYTPVVAVSATTGSTFVAIEFRDQTGAKVTAPDTNMRVFVTHGGGHNTSIDPTTVTTTTYPNHNLWLLGLMRD